MFHVEHFFPFRKYARLNQTTNDPRNTYDFLGQLEKGLLVFD